ncbi:hypothetical protein COD67_22420 [Bacillus cereus]|nr:hypothetical protein COI89_09620 [Bacillus cereus]PGU62808.1 hypothetical protein COD67_22420 [Bacillus cereus]
MKNSISCQIIIAENIKFDSKEKKHTAYNILNKINVPTLPSAVITSVLFKFHFSEKEKLEEIKNEIRVYNSNRESVFSGQLPRLKNFRDERMTPGIDGVIEIRFPVMESGKYEYVVYSNNHKIFSYPLFIDVIQTEEKDMELWKK